MGKDLAIYQLLDATRDGVFVFDPASLRFTYVNRGASAQVGYSRDELLTMTPLDIEPEFDEAGFRQMLAPLHEGRVPELLFTTVHRRKDGRDVPVEILLQCISDEQGARACVALVRDITYQRAAERAGELHKALELLRVSEERYRTLVEQASDGIFLVDWYHFHEVNPAGCAMLGYDREELLQRSITDVMDPVDAARISSELARLGPGVILASEWRLRRKDGSTIPVEVRARQVTNAQVLAIVRDVSESKRTEEALRDLNAHLEQRVEERTREIHDLYNNAPCGYHSLDANGRFLMINDTELRWLGYTREELIGRKAFVELLTPESVKTFTIHFPRFRRDGYIHNLEFDLVRKDGSPLPVLLSATAVRDAQGNFLHSRSTLFDRTELKRAQTELRRAKEEAERANHAKSEFLSRMSHELRTPLNGILGFGQLLENSALSDKDRRRVGQIVKAGKHLLGLINEVLDIARIEAGRMSLSLEPIHVRTICSEVFDLVQPLAGPRGIRLEHEPPPDDYHVRADNQRLKQVLLNLLSNAIKFNRPQGQVTLASVPFSERRLQLIVRDTGLGLSAEQQAHLFEPFNRLGAEQTGIEGTGLGLALSKRLVEAMGGTLTFESEVGRGSTFTVELPRADGLRRRERPLASPASTAATAASQRTVLYVEDNLANLNLVEDILSDRPEIRLVTAMQASLGLELARRHRPDLILLDLHLPDFPGDVFVQRLQADSALRSTPVVILSADATPRQIERLRALGVYEYLTKPLDVNRFLAVLEKVFQEQVQ